MLLLLLASCHTAFINYKYRIHTGSAVYMVESISYKHDTVGYYNTDGKYNIISIHGCRECKIDTLKHR